MILIILIPEWFFEFLHTEYCLWKMSQRALYPHSERSFTRGKVRIRQSVRSSVIMLQLLVLHSDIMVPDDCKVPNLGKTWYFPFSAGKVEHRTGIEVGVALASIGKSSACIHSWTALPNQSLNHRVEKPCFPAISLHIDQGLPSLWVVAVAPRDHRQP